MTLREIEARLNNFRSCNRAGIRAYVWGKVTESDEHLVWEGFSEGKEGRAREGPDGGANQRAL